MNTPNQTPSNKLVHLLLGEEKFTKSDIPTIGKQLGVIVLAILIASLLS